MNETRTLCDRGGCNKPDARKLHLFKERKADTAGGMENWYYTFDLCVADIHELLGDILDEVAHNDISAEGIVTLLKAHNIKWRVE